ncbi:MAG: RNA methyltransferase [Pirellulaceae bacterium]|jgi:TrmH family RNA methyltransferase|nr:RNA methyltransferase [Pirellulaceae bacterium]
MTSIIHSLHNPRIKLALRLRDRRGRLQQRRMIIDGWRESCRALVAGVEPCELFLCADLLEPSQQAELAATARARRCEPTLVTRDVFHKLAFGQRGEGVVLVATLPQPTLADMPLADRPLICVLEGLEKPGNLGAVVRTADAAGVSAVIVADGGTDLYNPNAIRASLGTIFHVPVCAAPAVDVRAWLTAHGVHVFAARVDGATSYADADLRGPCALVLGSEARGLSSIWQCVTIDSIVLPMCGLADSLNVAATAAVLFYEAWRQRRTPQGTD